MVGKVSKFTDEVLDTLAASLVKWVKDCKKKDEFKLLSEWCFENDYSPFYFKRHTVKHDGFRDAYEWAKAYQEYQVARGGLNKKFDPRFSQFFLGCQHGWRSKDSEDAQKKNDLRNDFVKFLDHIKDEEEDE